MDHLTKPFSDQTVIQDSSPFSLGPQKIVGALCEDGKQRTAVCSDRGADTFFSIPARVRANGKTVSGYVTRESVCVRCGLSRTSHDYKRADGGYDWDSPKCADGGAADVRDDVWLFITYRYGKNAHAILGPFNNPSFRNLSDRPIGCGYCATCGYGGVPSADCLYKR